MNLDEVMRELESLGTETNRRIYKRHGAGDNLFGVSFANLNKLKKRIKTDQALADALWQTGNADARSLALMVADPAAFSSAELDRWAADVEETRYYGLADLLSQHVAGRSPLAREKAETWSRSEQEYVAQTGWDLIGMLAMNDSSLPDSYFEGYMDQIESSIHGRKNRVKYAMNGALIAIGLRNDPLRARAFAVAESIGKVHVDHGETGCKTPDATAYIKKAWGRRGAA